MNLPVVALLGPTASGKTRYAFGAGWELDE